MCLVFRSSVILDTRFPVELSSDSKLFSIFKSTIGKNTTQITKYWLSGNFLPSEYRTCPLFRSLLDVSTIKLPHCRNLMGRKMSLGVLKVQTQRLGFHLLQMTLELTGCRHNFSSKK